MAQKKKKKPAGARKSTYAKGKKIEPPKTAPARRPTATTRPTQGAAKQSAKGDQKQVESWNLVRKGTLEAKVMLALLAIIAVVALARFPLTQAEGNVQYKAQVVEYKKQVAAFEKKYPTAAEQKKHSKDKPAAPKAPTTSVIVISVLFGAIQSAIFAFLGLNILRRTDLRTPVLDKSLGGEGIRSPDLLPFATWSIPAGVLIIAPLYLNARISSILINNVVKTNGTINTRYPLYKEMLGSFNDGMFFFVLFVLVAVPVLVWVFTRYNDRTRVEPHWGGILGAALLAFGFIWLNVGSSVHSAAQHAAYSLGLALPVVIMGYVFWKKGLEYSMLAALIGFGFYPLIASFVVK
ncbi:MAG TPA: hypothetical protein VIK22_02435 [Candidatus Anoxymicrobiaceae bacterium]